MIKLGENVIIESGVVIEDNVVIGNNNILSANSVIKNGVIIGNNNYIGHGTVIGGMAETLKEYPSGNERVIIGNNNTINHQVTIDSSTTNHATNIGDNNLIMSKVHLGHDVSIGNYTTLSTGSMIGGFTIIGNYVNIGLNTSIHQRLLVGDYVMVGMGSVVTKSIEPYCTVIGVPAKYMNINVTSLIKNTKINTIEMFYELLNENNSFVNDIILKFNEKLNKTLHPNKIIKLIKK